MQLTHHEWSERDTSVQKRGNEHRTPTHQKISPLGRDDWKARTRTEDDSKAPSAIVLFFTLHFFSFSQGMQTRERAHCARSVFPFIKKKKSTASSTCRKAGARGRHTQNVVMTPGSARGEEKSLDKEQGNRPEERTCLQDSASNARYR